MAPVEGKVIAITGAASGIGLETARLLFKHGASLALADTNPEGLTSIYNELNTDSSKESAHRLQANKVDVVSSNEVAAWFDSIIKQFGKLDGACNFAGISGNGGANIGQKPFHQLADDDFDAVIRVNVKGVFNCVRAEVQRMIGKGGSIVNAASIAGLIGVATGAPYSTSKASITIPKIVSKFHTHTSSSMRLSDSAKAWRRSLEAKGSVSIALLRKSWRSCVLEFLLTVKRGLIDTPMLDGIADAVAQLNVPIPLGRHGSPQEVARLVAFLLSDESTYITGSVHTIDGGWLC